MKTNICQSVKRVWLYVIWHSNHLPIHTANNYPPCIIYSFHWCNSCYFIKAFFNLWYECYYELWVISRVRLPTWAHFWTGWTVDLDLDSPQVCRSRSGFSWQDVTLFVFTGVWCVHGHGINGWNVNFTLAHDKHMLFDCCLLGTCRHGSHKKKNLCFLKFLL